MCLPSSACSPHVAWGCAMRAMQGKWMFSIGRTRVAERVLRTLVVSRALQHNIVEWDKQKLSDPQATHKVFVGQELGEFARWATIQVAPERQLNEDSHYTAMHGALVASEVS